MKGRLQAGSRPALTSQQALALLLTLVAGLALGFTVRLAFFSPAPAPAASAPRLVTADPKGLVVQQAELPATYQVGEEQQEPDPGHTNARARYSEAISRTDSSHYLAQCAVNEYDSIAAARSALQTLLGLGQFGTELALHSPLGDEAHLYTAKDQQAMVVVGSVIWRQRNVVAYVFVYSPYSAATPPDELDRLARGTAYDDTLALAARTSQRISEAP